MSAAPSDPKSSPGSTNPLPKGFWRLIIWAVVLGNAGLLIAIKLGGPSWLAASIPATAVGIAGVILAYRKRTEERTHGE